AHKSAAGLVRLGLDDRAAVSSAAEQVLDRLMRLGVGGAADSLLVVEQVSPGIDLILSARSDPEFGVVGLLGLGGTDAEALGAFRVLLAPFEPAQVANALEA